MGLSGVLMSLIHFSPIRMTLLLLAGVVLAMMF